MTKILHITSGQYLTFLSSNKYDTEHPLDTSEEVVDYENSYSLEHYTFTIEEYVSHYIHEGNRHDVGKNKFVVISSLNELEIIYD
jgi:hypothetical protein